MPFSPQVPPRDEPNRIFLGLGEALVPGKIQQNLAKKLKILLKMDFDCAHLQPSAGSFDELIDMLVFTVSDPQVQLPSLQSGNIGHTAEFQ